MAMVVLVDSPGLQWCFWFARSVSFRGSTDLVRTLAERKSERERELGSERGEREKGPPLNLFLIGPPLNLLQNPTPTLN